jgi:hypothetical protein
MGEDEMIADAPVEAVWRVVAATNDPSPAGL